MKTLVNLFLIIAIGSCCANKPVTVTEPADNNDTLPVEGIVQYVLVKDTVDSIRFENELRAYKSKLDSIEKEVANVKKLNDSLNIQLFNANYKLNKIAEYNRLAAKNNNIKYLRGWINRALGE